MTRLTWDQGDLDVGVDRCVLYLPTEVVAWSGVTSVTEIPDAGDDSSVYLDGVKFLTPQTGSDFALSVNAVTYPDEFSDYSTSDPGALPWFGFSYRTKNQIHLVYNVRSEGIDAAWKTTAQVLSLMEFTWTFKTTPINYPGIKPTAHFILDMTILPADVIETFEDILYGTDTEDATLPPVREVLETILTMTVLRIYDNGDGTWTAVGPDSAITMLDATTFQLSWPSVVSIDANSFTASDG